MTEYTVKQNNVDAWHLVPAQNTARLSAWRFGSFGFAPSAFRARSRYSRSCE